MMDSDNEEQISENKRESSPEDFIIDIKAAKAASLKPNTKSKIPLSPRKVKTTSNALEPKRARSNSKSSRRNSIG